jgi:hypothetical protein
VHLQFLALSNLRLSVLAQWMWTFMTGQRGSRIIVNHHEWQGDKTAAPPPATESHFVTATEGQPHDSAF